MPEWRTVHLPPPFLPLDHMSRSRLLQPINAWEEEGYDDTDVHYSMIPCLRSSFALAVELLNILLVKGNFVEILLVSHEPGEFLALGL